MGKASRRKKERKNAPQQSNSNLRMKKLAKGFLWSVLVLIVLVVSIIARERTIIKKQLPKRIQYTPQPTPGRSQEQTNVLGKSPNTAILQKFQEITMRKQLSLTLHVRSLGIKLLMKYLKNQRVKV